MVREVVGDDLTEGLSVPVQAATAAIEAEKTKQRCISATTAFVQSGAFNRTQGDWYCVPCMIIVLGGGLLDFLLGKTNVLQDGKIQVWFRIF